MARKKTLCIDFDGVIHSYTSGWNGHERIDDPPVEGAIEFLYDAHLTFKVAIFSSRSSTPQGIKAMQNYIAIHACKVGPVNSMWWLQLEWPVNKPAAFLSIDDRAMLFNGYWPSILELVNFTAWHERLVPRPLSSLTEVIEGERGER